MATLYKLQPINKESTFQETFRPLIEAGQYEAQCVGFSEFKQFGGLKKLCLSWDFTLSGKEGILLPQFFNMEHAVFKENSHFYEAWVIANNCQRPMRRTRKHMSPKIFENIIGTVLVVTVKPKFPNGEEKPTVFHYSKVQCLMSLSVKNNGRIK